MLHLVHRALTPGIVFALFAGSATAQDTTLHSLRTPRGVTQAFILIKPQKPVAAVVLFAGGHGALGLKGPATMAWGAQNFLVRTRYSFARQGLMVAVVDAPSDKQGPRGMNAVFRMGGAHANDIGAVVDYLKKQADVPVWLAGTSMGTFSATSGSIALKSISGVVLTSTVTRSKPGWDIAVSHPHGVASMKLSAISVPALIVAHRHDGCVLTPAEGATKLARALTKSRNVHVVLLDGGSPPRSGPCQALSAHGFLGIESQAVTRIAQFIKAN